MRELATRKRRVFVQANSNSGQGHYITSFCVAFRLSTLYFRLAGKTETKQVVNRMSKWAEGGGSWKGHESGQAVFIFLAASRANFAATPLLRSARQNRHATQANFTTDPVSKISQPGLHVSRIRETRLRARLCKSLLSHLSFSTEITFLRLF